jgi:hypothetical protein
MVNGLALAPAAEERSRDCLLAAKTHVSEEFGVDLAPEDFEEPLSI